MNIKQFSIASVVGMTMCASYLAATASDVTARQRYPWNGMVDVDFTIEGTSGMSYETSFFATDQGSGSNVQMKTLIKEDGTLATALEKLFSGHYRWVWDASKDLPGGVRRSFRVLMNAKKCYDEVGLVAYWPFDGDDNDLSGNGYHLANSSLIWTNGVNAKAAYFNGTFNSPIIKSLTVSTSMTVALWAKPKKVGDTDASILMGRGSFGLNFRNFAFILQGGFGLSIEMQRVLVFKDDNCYLLKNINLADGWHHIAVSVSGGGKPTLYIDGVMISDANVVAFDGISISSPTVGGA